MCSGMHGARKLLFIYRNRVTYSGPEHYLKDPGTLPPPPSYCTLHMFHAPLNRDLLVSSHRYISRDGHLFDCKSPVEMQQAFHV